jgi:hypothetical protein
MYSTQESSIDSLYLALQVRKSCKFGELVDIQYIDLTGTGAALKSTLDNLVWAREGIYFSVNIASVCLPWLIRCCFIRLIWMSPWQ